MPFGSLSFDATKQSKQGYFQEDSALQIQKPWEMNTFLSASPSHSYLFHLLHESASPEPLNCILFHWIYMKGF